MNIKHLFLLVLLSTSCTLFAQDVQKDFNTSSISIFKNGTAFFIKSGKVKTENSTYKMTEHIPPALFGTYWVISPANELDFLTSYLDTVKTSKKILVNSIGEMLNANLGKKVTLHVGKKDEIIRGLLEQVAITDNAISDPSGRNIIDVSVDGRWITLINSEIRRIEFQEKPNQLFERENQKIKPILEVNFNTDKKEQELDMMYLSNGLDWTPMYLIELTGEEKARLSLRAEVVNNVEDIENTDVNFVVGVPNFTYANKLSALLDLVTTLPALIPRASTYSPYSNSIASQSINSYAINEDVAFGAPSNSGISTGLDGSAEEDLYFYTLKNMNLKKGGRGHYPVFTTEIPIAHIYECNLPQNNADKYSYQEEYFFSPDPNKVFHSLKVVNDTKYPFTTGPALVVKQQGATKPISQDRINYTPVNGNSFVKLTEAPDVRIKQAEKAIEKQERAKTLSSGNSVYYYDLITVEGQVEIKNYKDKKINLNIRRTIIGDLQKSNVKWLKAERVNTSGNLNKTTDVCWETSIDASEEITITYSYQIYVVN